VRYSWHDVAQVEVRRTRRRGIDTRVYGIQVRLVPGIKPPAGAIAVADGWFVVWSTGLRACW
jgi:hypothetical protein